MLARVIACAGFVAFAAVGSSFAQSGGPAEVPDGNYEGQSYIDSKGCIFLKAGYGGAATWVARLDKDRRPICGQTPTNAVAMVEDAKAVAASPAQKAKRKSRIAASVADREPVMIGCPVSVPVARRYATTDGGSVVICTAKNGSLTGARSPIYPAGSGVGPALSGGRYAGTTIPLPDIKTASVPTNRVGANPVGSNNAVVPPPGYELAWKDDRLNPLRGKSVAGGVVNQDTASVPAVVVAAKPAKAAAALATGSDRFYVQVGAFGEPSNAAGASARLKAMGYPVSKGQFSKQGKALQVIYAGPFATGLDAQAALTFAHNNGFSDAFIR